MVLYQVSGNPSARVAETSQPGKSDSKCIHIIVGGPQFLTDDWLEALKPSHANLSGGLFTIWLPASPEPEMKERGEKRG